MMQNMMANIAPMIEVVSLNNNSVASSDAGLPILPYYNIPHFTPFA